MKTPTLCEYPFLIGHILERRARRRRIDWPLWIARTAVFVVIFAFTTLFGAVAALVEPLIFR